MAAFIVLAILKVFAVAWFQGHSTEQDEAYITIIDFGLSLLVCFAVYACSSYFLSRKAYEVYADHKEHMFRQLLAVSFLCLAIIAESLISFVFYLEQGVTWAENATHSLSYLLQFLAIFVFMYSR